MSYIISEGTDAPCFKCNADIGVPCRCSPRGIDDSYLTDSAKYLYKKALVICDSPIEKMLLKGLQVQSFDEDFEFTIGFDPPAAADFGKPAILCVPQLPIPPYIADFVLFDLKRSKPERCYALVVECDGHDYHERTKEQAAHDRSRDRIMQFEGFEVIRFTGAEIYADAYGCANQIIAFIRRGIR